MAGACLVSSGPLPLGKCPRQRRALERGLVEEDGYRMKFACYYPRVEYGQSSCPACARPPHGLWLCLLLPQAHRQPLSDTTLQPSQPPVLTFLSF